MSKPLADSEAEPCTAVLFTCVWCRLGKAVEEATALLFRDTDACIDNMNLQLGFLSLEADFNLALFGKFHRIIDQVVQDLPQAHFVSADRCVKRAA